MLLLSRTTQRTVSRNSRGQRKLAPQVLGEEGEEVEVLGVE